jgi:hypothetical protein
MEYAILALRTVGEDDGRLYPVLSDELAMAVEPLDGEPLCLTASRLLVRERVAGELVTRLCAENAKADVLVGDARLAVRCSKFDKGVMGIGAAMHAEGNGGARTGSSEMLVGHVRYPWLRCVGFKPKAGWGSSEELRLGVMARAPDGSTRELFLDIRFPKGIDSAAVARAAVASAARYHLAYGELADEAEQESWEGLADRPSLAAASSGKFVLYRLPSFSLVNAMSAYPVPSLRAEPKIVPSGR